jgi:Spy/CpxP family protein refolding chaperone
MKKTLLIIPALALAFGLMAQQPQRPGYGKKDKPGMERRGGLNKGGALQNIDLTEAQQNQMKTLQMKFREQMKALGQNENISVKEQRDARFNLAKEHRNNIDKILTTEQKSKLKEQRINQQGQKQEMLAKRFDQMAQTLALTDAQKATLQKEREVQRAKMEALRLNENFDRTAFQTSMKEIRANREATMKSVLTSAQYEKWEEMKKQSPPRRGQGRGFGQGRGMQV